MEINLELEHTDTLSEDLIEFLKDFPIDVRDILPGILIALTTKSSNISFSLNLPYQRQILEKLLKLFRTQPALGLPCQILEASIPFAPDLAPQLPPPPKSTYHTPKKKDRMSQENLVFYKPRIAKFIQSRDGGEVSANEITTEFGLLFHSARVITKELIAEGKVIFNGKARATRYFWSATAALKTHQIFQIVMEELNYPISTNYKNPLPKALSAPPNTLGIDWSKVPLGKEPDPILAEKLGTTQYQVRTARRKLGIMAFLGIRKTPPTVL